MARMQIHTYEPDVSMDAVVPEYLTSPQRDRMTSAEYYAGFQRDFAVLWLLHSAEGSSADWFRYSQVELFAEEKGMIVVCPNAENGFFTNMVRGVGWSDIYAIKLWPMVHKILPTSDRREKNFIAGIGMGGYGAIKLALENPELFCGAAAFDGWLDAPQRFASGRGDYPDSWALEDVFGNEGVKPENDLIQLLHNVKESGVDLPEFYLDFSENSKYCKANKKFAKAAQALGYKVQGLDNAGAEKSGWRAANLQLEAYMKQLDI